LLSFKITVSLLTYYGSSGVDAVTMVLDVGHVGDADVVAMVAAGEHLYVGVRVGDIIGSVEPD